MNQAMLPIDSRLKAARHLETTIEWHYPGYNFMGPGTHIIGRVLDGIQPVNHDDYLSLIHDVQSLLYAGRMSTESDAVMKSNTYNPLIKIGLALPRYLRSLPGISVEDTQYLGHLLAIKASSMYKMPYQAFLLPSDLAKLSDSKLPEIDYGRLQGKYLHSHN